MADQARVCMPCTQRTAIALGQVPAYVAELATTIRRLDRVPRAFTRADDDPELLVGPICATYRRTHRCEHPSCQAIRPRTVALKATALPYNAGVTVAVDRATNTLTTWVRLVHTEAGGPDVATVPADAPAGLVAVTASRWLLGRLDWIRHHQAAAEALEQLRRAAATFEHLVDNPPLRRYEGPCDSCGTDVHTQPGATVARCRECGTTWRVDERRSWLTEQARDYLLTTQELLTAVPGLLGQNVNTNTVRSWQQRGRLPARGMTPDGHKVYRVGDLIDLVTVAATRRTKVG